MPSRSTRLLLLLTALLAVLLPFLFWHGSWFGRRLEDDTIARYLSDPRRPRRVQHALSQVADRLIEAEAAATKWYPDVFPLAGHEAREIRATVAWVLGQGPQDERASETLSVLLDDPEPVVRRNAALSLARFGDDRGRGEILAMLRPYAVPAPASGSLRARLRVGDPVNPGTLLARLEMPEGGRIEVRAPVPGTVETWVVGDGADVSEGQSLVRIAPSEEEAWEALRALYLVGRAEDLPAVEAIARGALDVSERVREQARYTAQAIRPR